MNLAAGTAQIEYRHRTPYREKRLEGRRYNVIQFRNGYATRAPEAPVQFLGVRYVRKARKLVYAIRLDHIRRIKRWKK